MQEPPGDVPEVVPEVVVTEVKPSSSVLAKLPWFTASMFAVFVSMYYCVPQGSPAFSAVVLDVPGGSRRAWTWYTYALLHGSTLHLWMNMFSWSIYGALSEYENPPAWRTVLVSAVSIVSGALAGGWQYRLRRLPFLLLGVSGGIYGLLTCHLGNLVSTYRDTSLMYRMFVISALASTSITDVVLYCAVPDSETSYSAHMGGAIAGVLCGFALPPSASFERPTLWKVVRWASLATLAVYVAMGIVNLATIAAAPP